LKELIQSNKNYIKKLDHYEENFENNISYERKLLLWDKKIKTDYASTNVLKSIVNVAVKHFKN